MDEEEISERFDFDQTDYEFATGTRRFKRQTEEERIYGLNLKKFLFILNF